MIYNKDFKYSFNENACEKCGGKCCIGDSGNIFVNNEEILKLCEYFGLNFDEFVLKYLRKVGTKFSFKEVKFENGYACIFFNQNTRKCDIYNLRPKQCKTFPFWDYYKRHIEELKKECIGICF